MPTFSQAARESVDQNASSNSSDSVSRWHARLLLQFDYMGHRTVVRKQHHGPLTVQRPFYPEHKSVCHVYLLHPPAGLVGGDVIELQCRTAPGANALITTPGAGKFYRSGHAALQDYCFELQQGSCMEWLPQENIFYDASQAQIKTCFDLEDQAKLVAWDISILGRPAAREGFIHGKLHQSLEIRRNGRPLYLDRARWFGNRDYMVSKYGLQDCSCIATMVVVHDPNLEDRDQWIRRIRAAVQPLSSELFSVTPLRDLVVCRFLGASAQRAKTLFTTAWAIIRPPWLGREACPPRIWNT